MTSEQRPNPDAILAQLGCETRGRLKIYLGAAPGVGKTYAMLHDAQERRSHGIDVLVALVETHGRVETEALLEGLSVLPRAHLDYQGHDLSELDLDGLLARRPQLALVDELAHTNAPGSRHAKRYADVQELLDAGIDVWTTVNIQHLESLNDAVAQITGVRVRETVPDSFFELATELEVVDLPPEDLLARLEEGKVYVPELAERAISRFFRPGNLTALRELALRQAAQRVSGQMRSYMAAHAIPGPWPTDERLLVAVSPSPMSSRLVRTCKRMADRRQCAWLAVYVETSRHYHLPDADRDRVARNLALAEQLGAEIVTVPGEDPASELLRLARERNVTEIIVGKSHRPRWRELLLGSFIFDVIAHSGEIDVYVVTGRADDEAPRTLHSDLTQRPGGAEGLGWRAWLGTALAVLAGGLGAAMVHDVLSLPNLSMIFLLPVLFAATSYGLRYSVVASVVSLLVYDYFFVQPYYTFTVTNPQDLLALVMYLIVAVLTSRMTARLRDQADAARRREARTWALFSLSREIAAAPGLDEVLAAVVRTIHELFQVGVVVLVPQGEQVVPGAAAPTGCAMTEAECAAATWCYQHDHATGRGSDTLPGVNWYCLPLRTAHSKVGVLAVESPEGAIFSPRRRRLLEGMAGQVAVGIERVRLATE